MIRFKCSAQPVPASARFKTEVTTAMGGVTSVYSGLCQHRCRTSSGQVDTESPIFNSDVI